MTEGVSIDDLLDVAGRRCCAAPEETGWKSGKTGRVGYVQTTALLAMYINRYLCISLYYYHRVSSGSAESGSRLNQTIQGPTLPLPRAPLTLPPKTSPS